MDEACFANDTGNIEEQRLLTDGGFIVTLPNDYIFPPIHDIESFFKGILCEMYPSALEEVEALIQGLSLLLDDIITHILSNHLPITMDLAHAIANLYRTYS